MLLNRLIKIREYINDHPQGQRMTYLVDIDHRMWKLARISGDTAPDQQWREMMRDGAGVQAVAHSATSHSWLTTRPSDWTDRNYIRVHLDPAIFPRQPFHQTLSSYRSVELTFQRKTICHVLQGGLASLQNQGICRSKMSPK